MTDEERDDLLIAIGEAVRVQMANVPASSPRWTEAFVKLNKSLQGVKP